MHSLLPGDLVASQILQALDGVSVQPVTKFRLQDDVLCHKGRIYILEGQIRLPILKLCSDMYQFLAGVSKVLDIESLILSSYHLHTKGQMEQVNQILEQFFSSKSSEDQENWVSPLPCAELVYNNTVHVSTLQSPFFANYRFHSQFHSDIPVKCLVQLTSAKEAYEHPGDRSTRPPPSLS